MEERMKLLDVKKKLKAATPKFIREESSRRKRLPKSWRRPKGFHSKMRLRKAGKPRRVAIGYRTPKLVRNLDKQGDLIIKVSNILDLANVQKGSKILISSKLGMKKRAELIKKANEMKLVVTNFKDTQLYLKKVEEHLTQRKKKKQEKKSKKKEKEEKKKEKPKKEIKQEDKKEEPEEKKKTLKEEEKAEDKK